MAQHSGLLRHTTQSMEELLSTSRYVSTSTLNLSDVDSTLVDSDSAPEDSDVDVPTVLIPGSTAQSVTIISPDELHVSPKLCTQTQAGFYKAADPSLAGDLNSKENGRHQAAPIAQAGGAASPKRGSTERTTWIDGLRGIASIIIFTHHFGDNTFSAQHPETLKWGTASSFLRNGQLAVALFFLLSGRVLTYGFLCGGNSGKVRWKSLASAIFRRTIRLALPILVLAFMQQHVCLHGATDRAPEAEKYLKTGVLGIPRWCDIRTSNDFVRVFLQVLTNPDHNHILSLGGTLWSMYDQFWGSVYVYILSMFMVILPERRYGVYLFLIPFFWFVNSPNVLFVLGLMLSDLAASNITRRMQHKSWYYVLGLQLLFIAVALLFIVDQELSARVDAWVTGHTVRASSGTFGYDLGVWPQIMRFSYWTTAFCILCWVELSHAAQWFFSSRIFVFLGNITFGTYVIQMTVIYTIMPRLVLHFRDLGWSYWNNITLTYVLCLIITIFLGWVFYHTVDKGSLKLARWIWNELFEHGKTRLIDLPGKIWSGATQAAKQTPSDVAAAASRKWVQTLARMKRLGWFMKHWRTPVKRDRAAVTDADKAVPLDSLHSTIWTADLSGDREARQTAWLLRLNSFLWPVHFMGIPGLAIVWFYFNPVGPWSWDVLTFGSLWRMLWCLSIPYCLITYIGFSIPRFAHAKEYMDTRPVLRQTLRHFYILIVTQGSNEDAVRRGYNRMKRLEILHPSVRVVVLTDEPYCYPDLVNVVCPKDYKSPKGISKHKARALDYFRHSQGLTLHDWVLHMDEESTIDGESLRRCFDFIRYSPHDFGQGVIVYNAYKYWHNWFFCVADAIRVGDDLARFHLQFTLIKRPLFGVHGSFLMTNGQVENENTWDFGSLAEDFEFSQSAWAKGFTCGAIHGIVREQSPSSLRDFMKQRRRWYMGIRDIKGMYYLPQIAIKLWTVGIFCLVATVINIPFSFLVDGSPTPFWIVVCSNFCFANFYWLYLWGLVFQELDAGTKWWMIPVHFVAGVFIQPFASIAEGLAVMWALASEDTGKFEVIKK